jgi:hypothetical protein
MTSLQQIESNRRNALRSTGPKSAAGKLRSSKNAVRHGLTAETVIEPLEDPQEYKVFEQTVTADYNAETAIERELVLRLASLLWRLRRSTLIETGLLQLESDVLRQQRTHAPRMPEQSSAFETLQVTEPLSEIAQRFLRLSNLDNNVFERLGRYEMALWRQVRQTLFTLEHLRWKPNARSRRRQSSWQRMTGILPIAGIDR